MIGVAVNETDVPAQTGFAEAATETLTGKRGLTVMVTAPDVAGLPETHVALEVSMHMTISLFTGMNV